MIERTYSAAPVSRGARPLAWLAWGLCCVSLTLVIVGLAIGTANAAPVWRQLYLAALVASALVGGLVAARRPRNPVGWLFLGSSVSYALFAVAYQYALAGMAAGRGDEPLVAMAAWATSFLTLPGVGLILGILPLYYPTGRLPGPRWRPVAWYSIVTLALSALLAAARPGELSQLPGAENPFGVEALRPLLPALDGVWLVALLGSIVAAVAALVARLRGSRGAERQQMKWLAFAVLAWVALVLVSSVLSGLREEWYEVPALEALIGLAFAASPVAAGVAVLRYRLYAIDTLISRTLLYSVLTAAVAALYALVVGYLSALSGTSRNFMVAVVATGVVAVAFHPLRVALQRQVNRLIYGRRDEPRALIAALGQRLEGAVAADAVLPTIVTTLTRELKLPYAAVVLDQPDGEAAAASAGAPVAPTTALPLAHGGAVIGHLIVSARAPDEPFTPEERRMLEDLARQAGAAVYAARVTEELQESRERLVLAREEERRRLRNDLHDGLGPQLAALALKLETARNRLAHDPQAEELFDDLIRRTQSAIGDIRRVVYALRPPALDELGLRSALAEWVARYPQGAGPQIAIELPERLPPLPAAVEVAVYRIAQEAVTNVVRHAGATACSLALRLDEAAGRLTLEVRDNGRGIGEDEAAGVGLSSMRERAAELGGSLSVHAAQGGGTVLRVSLGYL